jgi:hypothetical protein
MANTWSFFPTAAMVIKAALRRIRGYDPEDETTISTVQYNNALESLNFIMSAAQAFGLQLWCRKTTSGTLVASQGSYTVGSGGNISINRPLKVMQAFLRDTNNIDQPLNVIGQQEYYNLSTKSQTGTPVSLYYDPAYDGASNVGTTSKGTIYLWPIPDATAAAEYTLQFLYQRPLEDFDATSDSIDMPQEWFNWLRLELAKTISPEYGMPVIEYDRLVKETEIALELAKSWDTEFESVYFQPDLR